MRLMSRLIKDISKNLQKLLKHFNGAVLLFQRPFYCHYKGFFCVVLLLSVFSAAYSSPSAPIIVIFPLTNIFASLYSHKLDFNIEVLNLV